jgi:hypothetical protein
MSNPAGYLSSSKWAAEKLNGTPTEIYRRHPRAGRAAAERGVLSAQRHGDGIIVTFIGATGAPIPITQAMLDGSKFDAQVLLIGDYPR